MALLIKTALKPQWVNKGQALVQDFLLHYGLLLGGLEKNIDGAMASERNQQERRDLFVL